MTDEQELTAEYETTINVPHSKWHDADKELPQLEDEEYIGCKVSIKVLVSDGENITITRYDYEMDGWLVIDMGLLIGCIYLIYRKKNEYNKKNQ